MKIHGFSDPWFQKRARGSLVPMKKQEFRYPISRSVTRYGSTLVLMVILATYIVANS